MFYLNKGIDDSKPFTHVIVLGPPRSGTSMISGTLRLMGVYMGEANSKNHEDPKFNAKKNELNNIITTIKKNNENHELWGWKEPSTYMYLKNITNLLDNPLYIVSCRNPFDSALSKIARTSTGDFNKIYQGVSKQYTKTLSIIDNLDSSCLYINYSDAVREPDLFVAKLAELLDISVSEDLMQEIVTFCEPGSYKTITTK